MKKMFKRFIKIAIFVILVLIFFLGYQYKLYQDVGERIDLASIDSKCQTDEISFSQIKCIANHFEQKIKSVKSINELIFFNSHVAIYLQNLKAKIKRNKDKEASFMSVFNSSIILAYVAGKLSMDKINNEFSDIPSYNLVSKYFKHRVETVTDEQIGKIYDNAKQGCSSQVEFESCVYLKWDSYREMQI